MLDKDKDKYKVVASSIEVVPQRKLMIFDLIIGGHHGNYIKHLIEYWCQQKLSERLDIVVSPSFLQKYSDIVALASKHDRDNINFVAITQAEEAALKPSTSELNRAFRAFQEWRLLCKYADLLRATECLIMYFDTCWLPLVLGMKSPCPFSGIYFRPTLHYNSFTHYFPSKKERVQQWREKLTLARILHHPQLRTLFCLDPFAVKYLNKSSSKPRLVHLPDPVQINNRDELHVTSLRERLGIQPDRQVFLLFGALTGRKGIYQLLDAISLLPPTLCQKLCLLFVGEGERARLESRVAEVCQSHPVQIIEQYEFVPEQDVQAYFQLTDIVLAPYQKHVGMSGILLLAAAAQKPILSSNYGLMGEIVRRYNLGLVVDSTVPNEIAKGLTRFILESPEQLCDRAKMYAFAEQNSDEHFARTIFQYV